MKVIIAIETGENRQLQPGETGLASKGGIMTWNGDCPSYSCFPVVKFHEFELEPGIIITYASSDPMYHPQTLLVLPKPKKKVVKEGWCKPSDIWWSDQPGAVEDMVKVTYEVEK